MISTFELYEKFCGTVNTHQGGHARPNRNFLHWVNDVVLEIYEEEIAEWEKSQVITDRLSPFLKSVNVVVTAMPNQMWDLVKLPEDYEHFAAARIWKRGDDFCGCSTCDTVDGKTGKTTKCDFTLIDPDEMEAAKNASDAKIIEKEITKVTNNRWGAICEHKYKGPTEKNRICTQYDKGIKLAPKGVGMVIVDYFRLPIPATFEYTILNPNTETEYIQYNPSSKKVEFSQTVIPDILARLQKKYGTFVREQVLYDQGERERMTKR